MLPGDGPVDPPEDYPCRYEKSCERCDSRGKPECPFTDEEE